MIDTYLQSKATHMELLAATCGYLKSVRSTTTKVTPRQPDVLTLRR